MSLRPKTNTVIPAGFGTRLQQVLRIGTVFELDRFKECAKERRPEDQQSSTEPAKREKTKEPINLHEHNQMQVLIYECLNEAYGSQYSDDDPGTSFEYGYDHDQSKLDMVRLWQTSEKFQERFGLICAFLKVMSPETQTNPNMAHCPTPEQAIDKLARIFFGEEEEIDDDTIRNKRVEVYVKLAKRFNLERDEQLIIRLLKRFHASNGTRFRTVRRDMLLQRLAAMIVNPDIYDE